MHLKRSLFALGSLFFISFLFVSEGKASVSVWKFGDDPSNTKTEVEQAITSLLLEINPGKTISKESRDLSTKPDTIKPSPASFDSPASLPEKVVTYGIPLEKHQSIDKYVKLFQTRLRPSFEKWLSRSGRYIPMMQEILREYKLPEDLVYLSLIESGFNPKAFSRSRASGVWQFIKGTGKHYGLRIDRWIDERRDPVKATHAAAKYLTDLYKRFGSWPLAFAGYNAGEGRVSRAIRRVKSTDFWKLRRYRIIRRETKNYVPKFMAAMMIAKDPGRYLFDVRYENPWKYDEVEIKRATYLSSIAKNAGISLKELKSFNPELKRDITPPRASGYLIKLPPGKKTTFLANYSPDKEPEILVGRNFKHRVRRGETITSIARRYGVSIDLLLETNQLHRKSIIRTGQHLLVSDGWRDGDKHRIRRGETISTIAVSYNVSMSHLLEVNQLHKRSIIRAGDTLIIPVDIRKHRIRRGETIGVIARKYSVRARDLLKVNRLKKGSVILAGKTLLIP